ncbi:MAG: glycine cleavage T C-terminal barrel domain-containing protein, partial [Pseudomonadota bacterium]
DMQLAAREGFVSVEHAKRYTTLGMATDQGKTSNMGGLAILAAATERTIAQTGTTIYRPPHVPVAIGALAGRNVGHEFQATRYTPSHEWARKYGAVFVEAGLWYRAQWYAQAGETHWLQSVNRETLAVRRHAGFCDVSSLGKIDIFGTDAGAFLDRVYSNMFSTLPVGKARYGLMLREDGMVMDDGTTSRLGENYYLMTTTTANASLVMQHLEFCAQVLWPHLDVHMVSSTDYWAQFSLAGPRARDVLQEALGEAIDLSNEAFPFMAAREFRLNSGITARIYRISFSGELAYEIAVPRRFGNAFASYLMTVGVPYQITPYGTEALSVLRIEKGHVTGNELNGMTSAYDIGLGGMMSKKKDYIGRIMAHREALVRDDRQVMVGLKAVDRDAMLRAGGHIIPRGAVPDPDHDDGHVTSVAYSPNLGHSIGLGFVKNGRERMGEIVVLHDPLRGADVLCEICSPIFIDPQGERMRG